MGSSGHGGVYFRLKIGRLEVVEFSSSIGSISLRLFSFELKRELGFGKPQGIFPNCLKLIMWANEGYLVAARFSGRGVSS